MGKKKKVPSTPTCRLRVCNLPKDIDEKRLKKLFSLYGRVTDVKLPVTSKGKQRKFAFIGFHDTVESKTALKQLNKTYIDTSRIQVEFAHEQGSDKIDRPWSKYSKGSSAHRKLNPEEYKDELRKKMAKERTTPSNPLEEMKQKIAEDSQLREFLDLHQKTTTWSNDISGPLNQIGEEQQKKDLSDIAWLASKQDEDGEFSDFSDEEDPENQIKLAEQAEEKRTISKTRLFVRNLSFHCSEEDLFALFKVFGEIKEVHLPVDDFNRFKGFAFVEFLEEEPAQEAKSALDGTIFQGRLVHIIEGKAAPIRKTYEELPDEVKETLSFNEKKEMQMKDKAEDDTSWNSLFIRSDTALSAVAEQLNVSKSDILDRESKDSLAVRTAAGETEIIQQTKQFLLQHGVDIAVFRGSKKKCIRSQTTFLIKNIPFHARESDLEKLFLPFGNISRLLVPSSKALALIEFERKQDAKKAFRRCAYRKFKNAPLFLEWAPLKTFTEEALKRDNTKKTEEENKKQGNETLIEPAPEMTVAEDERTVFVKNLNFDTTEKNLEEYFSKIGPLRSCIIPTYIREREEKKEILSRGFGFVEFEKVKHVKKALKKLNGKKLDGHKLQISIAKQKPTNPRSTAKMKRIPKKRTRTDTEKEEEKTTEKEEAEEEEEKEDTRTKLLVKNVAFEANSKELRELFGNYGSIKTIKLPEKFAGRHRGFGFIDFLTHNEALNAYQMLESTHFYGRKLVIEWAHKDDNSTNNLRVHTRKKLKRTI